VRGDVAFAQSILETAGFANPGSAPTDNNFAGIGWCDTCAHGFDFPDAPTGWQVADEFLFGPSLLVAPVLEAGATSRRVYLPAGATWTDIHSGTMHAGGTWVELDAPLDVIPVLARDGALPELVGRL